MSSRLTPLYSCLPVIIFLLLWQSTSLPPQSITLANDPAPTIVSVEEDWELVVRMPDSNSVAPQVTCFLSPTSSFDALFGAFDLNHRSVPDFQAGGLQVQLWNGDYSVDARMADDDSTMSSNAETVSWTQKMSLVNGQLVFEIVNGSSTTWGAFGGPGELQAATTSRLANLNGYDSTFSTDNSGVGYAANRVHSLVLKRVRLITDSGDVLEDTTSRTAFPLD